MTSVHKLLLAVLLGFLFTAVPGPAVIRTWTFGRRSGRKGRPPT